ncbi:MAG: alternative ribosome rescue aminoacyl-tRNA hydrolase ArfB [Victivallaceae bacterium]|nr:alternative ribosome rescue aminoacyl-tRNA hydrolase ArfB [Victivallaceae bacterium]
MLRITNRIIIPDGELKEEFFLASGPGGQHVNKVATAVRLRYQLRASGALPPDLRDRLLERHYARLTANGELLIEARRSRHREINRLDAAERLKKLILGVLRPPVRRRPTKPTCHSINRRLETKKKHGLSKKLRMQPPVPD